jgi:hypothetical protein
VNCLGGNWQLRRFNFVDSKGISVLFLVIGMLLIIVIGYVFSYLIPSKQKSVIYPIQSTQAFFIAQSGVEYAVRYAVAKNWRTTAALLGLNGVGVNQKTLGAGRFTITYNNTANTLTSVGEVPSGTERRTITVTNFTTFMQAHLVLTTPVPCLNISENNGVYTYVAEFHIRNIDTSGSITLNSFRADWDTVPLTINRIRFNSTSRYTGSYSNGAAQTNFSSNQTITNQTDYTVDMRWSTTSVPTYTFINLIVYFFDSNGHEYTFALDPEENGLPVCN